MSLLPQEPGSATVEILRASEMDEARSIQQAMVTLEPLCAPPFEIASCFRPVTEVGGDFLDYFWLEDRRLGLYLGDVVGKGLPAAMYAALAVGTLRGIHKRGTPPTTVLELMNERLRMRVVPGRYCAVQYAVFDAGTLEVWYANAALPRPVLVSAKGCREVGEGGLPSGMFSDARWEPYAVQLQRGEGILFCTDGILEARNAEDEEFGVGRLIEICQQNTAEKANTLLSRLFCAVDDFSGDTAPHDDMTAILLKIY